jgi:AcrR family transcriptional regulator
MKMAFSNQQTDSAGEQPAWRERAVRRSLDAARTRAEERVQRFLDAAFDLIDEKRSTDFTVQEVVDRSHQSLRSFYEYFDGKDELVLALFEETVHEAVEAIRAAVEAESDPLRRLHAFALTLYSWCDPTASHGSPGRHRRRALSEFSMMLTSSHAGRVRTALRPQTHLLRELITEALTAGALSVSDVREAATLVQQTMMYSAFGNRLGDEPHRAVDAERAWQFCLHGLGSRDSG